MFSAIAWLWTGYQMISNQERHQCGLPLSLGTSKIRFSADQDWNPCLQECSHPDAITGLHSSHRNRHTAQTLACLAQWFWVGTDRAKYIYIYIYPKHLRRRASSKQQWHRAQLRDKLSTSCRSSHSLLSVAVGCRKKGSTPVTRLHRLLSFPSFGLQALHLHTGPQKSKAKAKRHKRHS